jgi:MFS superfamily sulfate permease-like transporter
MIVSTTSKANNVKTEVLSGITVALALVPVAATFAFFAGIFAGVFAKE